MQVTTVGIPTLSKPCLEREEGVEEGLDVFFFPLALHRHAGSEGNDREGVKVRNAWHGARSSSHGITRGSPISH